MRRRVGPPRLPPRQAQYRERDHLDNLVERGHARGDAYDIAVSRAAPFTLHVTRPHPDRVAHGFVFVAKRGQDDGEGNRRVLIRRLDRDRQAVRLGQAAREREHQRHQ